MQEYAVKTDSLVFDGERLEEESAGVGRDSNKTRKAKKHAHQSQKQ